MHKPLLEFIESCELPTKIAKFRIHAFRENSTNKEHLAITLGSVNHDKPILARIHSQCITGESLFGLRCDCRFQLTQSLKRIAKNGSGVIFYLQQEGRGIGLINKIRAYKLQEIGCDTVEANLKLGFKKDERDYKIVGTIARYLDITSVNLMTNNPHKISSLEKLGIKVNKRIPIKSKPTKYNSKYLLTKAKKLGHLL